jgi:transcriptional regulator of acetoin/glycerol metabolism
VRELHFAVERAGLLAEDETIGVGDLPPELVGRGRRTAAPTNPRAEAPVETGSLDEDRIRGALDRARWRRGDAARILGVSPRTLYRWMKKLGLE